MQKPACNRLYMLSGKNETTKKNVKHHKSPRRNLYNTISHPQKTPGAPRPLTRGIQQTLRVPYRKTADEPLKVLFFLEVIAEDVWHALQENESMKV